LVVARVADSGDPALRIIAFADTHGVDLIMMPTHGLGRFRSFLVGSVTSKVLHDARCPVWTAAHAETQRSPELPRTVVCAIDGTPSTPRLLRWAAGFSADVGATLKLLHVVGPITDLPFLASERQLEERIRQGAQDQLDAMRKSAGIDAPLRVTVGEIVPTVTEQLRQEHADLAIVGRGSVSEPFGRLRTHSFGIIQRSPCPVLSV
jgi:nucleotide-binding universal stress UspA family protein